MVKLSPKDLSLLKNLVEQHVIQNRERQAKGLPETVLDGAIIQALRDNGLMYNPDGGIQGGRDPIRTVRVTVWKKNNDQYPWGGWTTEETDAQVKEKEGKEGGEPKKNQQKSQSQSQQQQQGNQPNTNKPNQSPQNNRNSSPNVQPSNGQSQSQSKPQQKNDAGDGSEDNEKNKKEEKKNQKGQNQKDDQKKQDGNQGGNRQKSSPEQDGNDNGDGSGQGEDGSDQDQGGDGEGRGREVGGSGDNRGTGTEAGNTLGLDDDGNPQTYNEFAKTEYVNVEIVENGDHRVEVYDTFDDFINAADDQDEPKSSWAERSSRDQGKEQWAGSGSFAEAIDLARSGWPEGVVRLDQIADAYHQLSKWTVDKTRSLDVAGTYPVVPIFLGGDPACMVNDGELNRGIKPVMHILVNRGYSWLVPSERVFNFGAAIMVCIDQIETLGVRVELDVCTANIGDLFGDVSERPVWATMTTVKKASEYVEKNRLAYALANPGYSRRLKYSLLEQIDKYEEPFHWGYGKPCELPPDLIPAGAVYIPPLEVMIPKGHQVLWDDITRAVQIMQRKFNITALADGTIQLERPSVEEAA